MKNIKILITGLAFFSLIILPSCLKMGLEDLPAFSDCDIVNIFFEYRFKDPNDTWIDGSPKVKFVSLSVDSKDIDTVANKITVTLSVPPASGAFTEEERAKVSLQNIVCMVNLSTAARIEPLNGAPKLGVPGDFSEDRQYLVTAADGRTTKTWTISVAALNKP